MTIQMKPLQWCSFHGVIGLLIIYKIKLEYFLHFCFGHLSSKRVKYC